MNIHTTEARSLAEKILINLNFTDKNERSACIELLIDAELAGKSSHGLMRLKGLAKMVDDGRVLVDPSSKLEIIKETPTSILVDGKQKTGLVVVPQVFEMALDRLNSKKSGIFIAGATNTAPAAGMIGYYAKKAAQQDLIYLGFHNSQEFLVPYGASEKFFGTNPMTNRCAKFNCPCNLGCE